MLTSLVLVCESYTRASLSFVPTCCHVCPFSCRGIRVNYLVVSQYVAFRFAIKISKLAKIVLFQFFANSDRHDMLRSTKYLAFQFVSTITALVKTIQNQCKHITDQIIVIIGIRHSLDPSMYGLFYLPLHATYMIRFYPHLYSHKSSYSHPGSTLILSVTYVFKKIIDIIYYVLIYNLIDIFFTKFDRLVL